MEAPSQLEPPVGAMVLGGDTQTKAGTQELLAWVPVAPLLEEGFWQGPLGETVSHSSCSGLRPSHLIELLLPFIAPAWLQVVPTCRRRQ